MTLIIVTDIFGLSDHTSTMAHRLEEAGLSVQVVDPYAGKKLSLRDEEDAYQTFLHNCGHEQYAKLVSNAIQAIKGKITMLAFSSGAAAAWSALGTAHKNKISHFIGLYPTQIQHNLHVRPDCPVTLLLPKLEEGFDVDGLMQDLSSLDTVTCIKLDLYHGFMNPSSVNFVPTQAGAVETALISLIALNQCAEIQNTLHQLPITLL